MAVRRHHSGYVGIERDGGFLIREIAAAGTAGQVRLLETESVVSLRGSNPEPLMFALGQKRTFSHL